VGLVTAVVAPGVNEADSDFQSERSADMIGLLEGRIAVTTEGAQGLGYAIAQALVKEGAKVVLGDLNAEGAADAAGQLGVADRAMGLSWNVTSASDVGLGHRSQAALWFLLTSWSTTPASPAMPPCAR
jgi:hypothetical protein